MRQDEFLEQMEAKFRVARALAAREGLTWSDHLAEMLLEARTPQEMTEKIRSLTSTPYDDIARRLIDSVDL